MGAPNPLPYQTPDLPITAVAAEIAAAVTAGGCVITAEPGAGKTSLVPLIAANSVSGTVIVCEPRRMAARSGAARLADLTQTKVGQEIGLTVRGESRRSARTRILVMTEGVLLAMISSDPELSGIGAIIFDEFHERGLNADLGLAMALEARSALRPDLSVSVMSATIDASPISELMGGAPIVAAPGRTFDIETVWSRRATGHQWTPAVAELGLRAHAEAEGSVLVFAPGRREISDLVASFEAAGVAAVPLHGGTPLHQQAEIMGGGRRRLIVASSVAETSITIPGIAAVVDGGLARRPVYHQGSGLGRLETGFVTVFAADQRRGRAGRLGPGRCYRSWSRNEHAHLDQAPVPEILGGDPLELGFRLAVWGDPYARTLPLLDPPPRHRLDAAYHRLSDLGITTPAGVLTDLGQQISSLGVHPRIGALIADDPPPGNRAIEAAALLSSDQFSQSDDFEAEVLSTRRETAREVKRLRRLLRSERSADAPEPLAERAAARWPDRLALARPGDGGRYLLATGSEVRLRPRSALLGSEALVVVDADGDTTSGFVKRAIPLTRAALIDALGNRIEKRPAMSWDDTAGRIRAEVVTAYGSLIFGSSPSPDIDHGLAAAEVQKAVARSRLDLLGWSKATLALRMRLEWLSGQDAAWPDSSLDFLTDHLDEWLDVHGCLSSGDLRRLDVKAALMGRLDWSQRARLDELAPETLPTISHTSRGATNVVGAANARVSYASGEPVWAVRLQWLLGMDRHPLLGPNRVPVTVELLSPAGRPVQRTQDLPGFWRGSYAAVRKDLRGRYPKHDWPENPLI